MPLPPAPTRRAARLDPEAFMTPPEGATPTTKRQRSTRGEAHPVAVPAAAAADTPVVAPAPAAPKAPASRSTKMPAKAALLSSAPAPEVAPSPETAPAVSAETPRRARKVRSTGPTKLFVLDTNVLLHDPSSLFRFEEHDIYLPMIVLEELDAHKKGMTEVARNGRQVSRALDALAAAQGADMGKGLKLDSTGQRGAGGSLFFQTSTLDFQLPTSLPQGKADNQILGVVEALRRQHAPREVVLVSKDINMRVKARALGLNCRGLPERQGTGGRRPALLRRPATAPGLLEPQRQVRGKLAKRRAHVLPHQWAYRAAVADQPVCVL
jgi:PhoH-like ATPase